jgi:putative glycosyltransferase (TIGR04372 family)
MKYLFKSFHLILGLVIAVAIRVASPFRNYKFGRLPSHEIGHYASNVEIYLCEKEAKIHGDSKNTIEIWYRNPDYAVANKQLDAMWSRVIKISNSPIIRYADAISRRLPGWPKFSISHHDRDAYGLYGKMQPHIQFSKSESKQGEDFLDSVRHVAGQKFVCVTVRDSSYKRDQFENRDLAHDDYRNNDISNFQNIAEKLASDGYLVFRMGAKVERPFGVDKPGVFDYASNGMRTDFLDVYLSANCEIFISTVLGLDSIPEIFRVPRVLTNYIPIANFGKYGPQDLIIPKQYWIDREARFMSFSEIVASKNALGSCTSSYEYQRAGLKLVENTPQEITLATQEVLARKNGNWQTTNEAELLQQKFWSLYDQLSPAGIQSRVSGHKPLIGTEFLRANPHWTA